MIGCSHVGIFSMGVAKPASKTEGTIKLNVPNDACCRVEHKEEINSPTPTIQETKIVRLK